MTSSASPPIATVTGRTADAALAAGHERLGERLQELTNLLSDLHDTPRSNASVPLELTPTQENTLVQVRLGIASSLYTALKWKHEPTARHCLRVALGCSAWVHRLGLPPERRDEIEVAALLHDVGKIGVPEQILTKPGPLTVQEMAVVEGHWLVGLEILRNCCAAKTLQDILLYTPAWFDGSRLGLGVLGESLPLGSRIVAIMDAFDSMINDHDYRPALTRQQAFHELHRGAGRQFDPRLVKSFCELHDHDESKLLELVPRRWLQQLDPSEVNTAWRLNDREAPSPQLYQMPHFQERLIDELAEAVIFIDNSLRIIRWNAAAARLTGVPAENVYLRNWAPSLLRLRDEHGCIIQDQQCPMAYALKAGTMWAGRLNLRGSDGHVATVTARACPVHGEDGTSQGLVIVFHGAATDDAHHEHSQQLHDIAARDPLTRLPNRAEFDRQVDAAVAAHTREKRRCSVLITGVDDFKQINEDYGHRAGDEVLRAYAALLLGSCRVGDILARYGGDEFIMFFSDCDGQIVARRGEQLRMAFADLPHEELGNKRASASYGVTEIQPGDTPDTMICRAKRALQEAKSAGRNKVVQLGSGQESASKPLLKLRCKFKSGDPVIEKELVSEVPLEVSVEKLRGFISDHHANVIELKETRVVLAVTCGSPARPLFSQRTTRFTMEIDFQEERERRESENERQEPGLRTIIKIAIRPEKTAERRQKLVDEHARQLLISLRAYLMAIDPGDTAASVLARAKGLLLPRWSR
jgi:diguanylate cyclase (GGDEF)-like protein